MPSKTQRQNLERSQHDRNSGSVAGSIDCECFAGSPFEEIDNPGFGHRERSAQDASRTAAERLVEPNEDVTAAVVGQLHRLDHGSRAIHVHKQLRQRAAVS